MNKLYKYIPLGLIATSAGAFAQDSAIQGVLDGAGSAQTAVFALVVTGVTFGIAVAIAKMLKSGK